MKTTKKHFELFKKECQKWIKAFNLSNWQVYYRHQKLTGEKNAFARLRTDLSNHVATIFLNKNWEGIPPSKGIKKSARHEVIHLLLARLAELAESRYITPTELNEAGEEIVNRLVSYFNKNEERLLY